MPIGAIAGATAVAGIGTAVIGSGATKSAAKSAAQTSQQATDAQLQLGRESLAQQSDIYNRNAALLNPWVQRGNVAGEAYNALLGLPSGAVAAPAQSSTTTNPLSPPSGAPGTFRPVQTIPTGETKMAQALASADYGYQPNSYGLTARRSNILAPTYQQSASTYGQTPVPTTATNPTSSSSTVNALSPTQAFDNFANSAGMNFQLQQGENALNNGYAAKGELQSGAAMKALQNYGQQTALQNYFMPYMNMLSGQSAQGAQAGSAVAGVGSNYGSTAANINANMAGYIGANAANAGNAALAAGAANANMWGNVGSSVGNALGMMGSSYINRGY